MSGVVFQEVLAKDDAMSYVYVSQDRDLSVTVQDCDNKECEVVGKIQTSKKASL